MDSYREARPGEGLPVLLGEPAFHAAVERLRSRIRGGEAPVAPPGAPQQLVVVLGVARSGTTWLQRLLLAHPLLGGPDGVETFLFHALGPLMGALERRRPPSGTDDDLLAVRSFCDELLAGGLGDGDARWFVEKTPLHILQIRRIRRLYPDVWFVHLLRDGRDVARSLAEVDFFDHAPTAATAALWGDAVAKVRAAVTGHDRFQEIRYETLVADPVEETARLLTSFGLEVDDQVRASLHARVGERVSRHGTSGRVGPGQWRELPGRELADIYVEAGAALVREGYLTATELRRWRLRPAFLAARLRRLLRRVRS